MAFDSGIFTSTSVTVNGDGIPVGNKAKSAAFLANLFYHIKGDGISLNPTSAFYVAPGSGLTVRVSAGWGIKSGYPYAETTDYDITLNSSTSEQTLYVGVRLDVATGEYTGNHVAARTTFVPATDSVFAIVIIPANAVTLTTAMITDTRYNAAYCGTLDEYELALSEVLVNANAMINRIEQAAELITVDTIGALPNTATASSLLINGAFDVWQRGTSFTATGYTADRWKMTLGTGQAITATRQSFTVGQTDVPKNPAYYAQLAISNAGSANGAFEQRIENVATGAGESVAYSFYAKCVATTYAAQVQMTQNFGSGGSTEVAATAQNITLTTSWQKFEGTFSLASISGKTVGANNYLSFKLIIPTASGTKTLSIANVQLNYGAVALPFVPRSYADELRLCRRYYRKHVCGAIYGLLAMGQASSSTVGHALCIFDSPMRISPTLATSGATTLGFTTSTYNVVQGASLAQESSSVLHVGIALTVSLAVLVAGDACILIGYNDATAYVAFDAEL